MFIEIDVSIDDFLAGRTRKDDRIMRIVIEEDLKKGKNQIEEVISDLEEYNQLLTKADDFIEDGDWQESEEEKQARLNQEWIRRAKETNTIDDLPVELQNELKPTLEKISARHYELLDKYHSKIFSFYKKLKNTEAEELNSETNFLENMIEATPIINEN